MDNYSCNRVDRGEGTALCQLGLQFHKQFFSVLHQRGVWEKTHKTTLPSLSTMGALHPAMAAQVTT